MKALSSGDKKCSKCKRDLKVADFQSDRSRVDGYSVQCRSCMSQRHRIYYRQHPEKRAENIAAMRARADFSELCKKSSAGWRKRYPEKLAAQESAKKAIKSGTLVREPCEVCGKKSVHAHHDDYTKPLSVRWLCPSHHMAHHRACLNAEIGWIPDNDA